MKAKNKNKMATDSGGVAIQTLEILYPSELPHSKTCSASALKFYTVPI